MAQLHFVYVCLTIFPLVWAKTEYNVSYTFTKISSDSFTVIFKGINTTTLNASVWNQTKNATFHNVKEIEDALKNFHSAHDEPNIKNSSTTKLDITADTKKSGALDELTTAKTIILASNKSDIGVTTSNVLDSNEASTGKTDVTSDLKISKDPKGTPMQNTSQKSTDKSGTKPLPHSSNARKAVTGILVTITVVVVIVGGVLMYRKYRLGGSSETYFLLR